MRVNDQSFLWLDHASLQVLLTVDMRFVAVVLTATRAFHRDNFAFVFRVTSGLRTREEQTRLVAQGASQTMNSAHLDGFAVDMAILSADRRKAFWEYSLFQRFNVAMQAAAVQIGLDDGDLLWGGDWVRLRDVCYWQVMLPAI